MKTAVFTFGRMNPMTSGHEKLVNKVRAVARLEGGEPLIYLSHSQDAKKNPLQYTDKVNLAQKAFGKIVKRSAANTIIKIMQELEKRYNEVVLVVGSDRVEDFRKLLTTYNGKDYNFNSIEVVSAGERDPDADDVSGMSASKMRALAIENDFETFKEGLPTNLKKEADSVFSMLRKAMKLKEDFDPQLMEQVEMLFEGNIEDIRKKVIDLVNSTQDASILNDILMQGSRSFVKDNIDKMQNLGPNDKSALNDLVFSTSGLDVSMIIDFFEKNTAGHFKSSLDSILFQEGQRTYGDLKAIHPFIDKILDKAIDLRPNKGNSGDGPGEFLFRILGGSASKKGDISFNGKVAEIKGQHGYLTPTRGLAGAFGYKDKYYAQFAKAAISSNTIANVTDRKVQLELIERIMVDNFGSNGKKYFTDYARKNTVFDKNIFDQLMAKIAFDEYKKNYGVTSIVLFHQSKQALTTVVSGNIPTTAIKFAGFPQVK